MKNILFAHSANAIEPSFAERMRIAELSDDPQALEAFRARPVSISHEGRTHTIKASAGSGGGRGASVIINGVAIIPIVGPMFKGYGSWGYADQIDIRNQVVSAAAESNAKSILLYIDSPGGSVAGTQEAADAITEAAKKKNTIAYIEDLGASAAYWLAAGARKIYTNQAAFVGSIGVITALMDASKFYEQAGIKVHPIVTGKFKGVGDPTQPVTEEHVSYLQDHIDTIFSHFVGAVSRGRKMTPGEIRGLQAKVFDAREAHSIGLTDGVRSIDDVFARMNGSGQGKTAKAITEFDASLSPSEAAAAYRRRALQIAGM